MSKCILMIIAHRKYTNDFILFNVLLQSIGLSYIIDNKSLHLDAMPQIQTLQALKQDNNYVTSEVSFLFEFLFESNLVTFHLIHLNAYIFILGIK